MERVARDELREARRLEENRSSEGSEYSYYSDDEEGSSSSYYDYDDEGEEDDSGSQSSNEGRAAAPSEQTSARGAAVRPEDADIAADLEANQPSYQSNTINN